MEVAHTLAGFQIALVFHHMIAVQKVGDEEEATGFLHTWFLLRLAHIFFQLSAKAALGAAAGNSLFVRRVDLRPLPVSQTQRMAALAGCAAATWAGAEGRLRAGIRPPLDFAIHAFTPHLAACTPRLTPPAAAATLAQTPAGDLRHEP